MAGGLLHVPERHAGVEGCGDEGVAEGVRPNRLVDPRPAGEATHNPPCGVAVEPRAIPADEDRTVDPLSERQVDRSCGTGCERDRDDLAALAQHREGAMAALDAERLDVSAQSLRDAQTVDGE